VPACSSEFDDWGHHAFDAGDVDALLDFENKAPAGLLAHPPIEHFAPLFVVRGWRTPRAGWAPDAV
jgi:4,5-DOPA dioxygenase extradiol